MTASAALVVEQGHAWLDILLDRGIERREIDLADREALREQLDAVEREHSSLLAAGSWFGIRDALERGRALVLGPGWIGELRRSRHCVIVRVESIGGATLRRRATVVGERSTLRGVEQLVDRLDLGRPDAVVDHRLRTLFAATRQLADLAAARARAGGRR